MNGPMSGFLQEHQVARLHNLLKLGSLKHLLEYYAPNSGIIRVREYFEALPDITEEEIDKQRQDFREWPKKNTREGEEGDGK